ncbi:type II restriction endonuclease, partial [Rhodobacter sp. NSM]|uniref:type II restriction endonuclease n=1 Tax=Rhodobacter sp. NSM TaxID=3457501 RepID=UPI003FCFA264
MDAESTGSLTIFTLPLDEHGAALRCHVWVCRHETEEDPAEERFRPVEPGRFVMWSPEPPGLFPPFTARPARCWLEPAEVPPTWLAHFPTGADIVRKTVEIRLERGTSPDKRLLRRRDCEFEIFRSVEEAVELPTIRAGFKTLDDFTPRRRRRCNVAKRAPADLWSCTPREILIEERFREGTDLQHGPQAEPGKRPDFLFPSQIAYRDPSFPPARLRMLVTKTTCRDRWRQVINEAGRIQVKHLLTLQSCEPPVRASVRPQPNHETGRNSLIPLPQPLRCVPVIAPPAPSWSFRAPAQPACGLCAAPEAAVHRSQRSTAWLLKCQRPPVGGCKRLITCTN